MMLLLRRKRMTKTFQRPRNLTILMMSLLIQIQNHVTVDEILVIAATSLTINEDWIRGAAVRIRGRGRVIDTNRVQATARVVTTASEAGDAVGVEVGIEVEVACIVTAVVTEMTTTTGVMRQTTATDMTTTPTDMRDNMNLVMIIIIVRIAIKIMCTR